MLRLHAVSHDSLRSSIRSCSSDGVTISRVSQRLTNTLSAPAISGPSFIRSAHAVAFTHAVDLLVRRGLLVRAAAPSGRERDVVYERGPAFGELGALRERLAAALLAR